MTGKAALSGRKGYQLAERFFNIWFLMRQATRRDRRNLIFLTRFIECTRTSTERAELARELVSQHLLSRNEHTHGLAAKPKSPAHSSRYELRDHVARDIADASRELALVAAYKGDWASAWSHLGMALDLIADHGAFPEDTYAGWIRAPAILIHLGGGNRLLEFLRERGDSQRLRPWYEAIRAQLRGDRLYLRNIPAEMQDVAGVLYDQIQTVLDVLPDSTRR